jgi:hypothetical protein
MRDEASKEVVPDKSDQRVTTSRKSQLEVKALVSEKPTFRLDPAILYRAETQQF